VYDLPEKMNQRERLESVLIDFLPPPSIGYIVDFIIDHRISFRIAKKRKTKLGDYRPPYGNQGHRISINHDLNPYQFLITTVHELAHLSTWEKYKNRVKSHGREWQNEYGLILKPLLNDDIFPEDLMRTLERRLLKPAASSCSDPELSLILQKYDSEDGLEFVKDIPIGQTFMLEGRIFKKGELMRKRYKCLNLHNKRLYMVHSLSRAKIVEQV
jgi:SprT protein